MINAYYAHAVRLGVKVLYEAEVRDLEINNGTFTAASFVTGGKAWKVRAKCLVAASG